MKKYIKHITEPICRVLSMFHAGKRHKTKCRHALSRIHVDTVK